MKSILYNESSMGSRFEYSEIPDDMMEQAEKWRHHLIEETASYDEHLMEKYLNDEEITITDQVDHNYFTGDAVYYTPEKSQVVTTLPDGTVITQEFISSQIFDEGLYYHQDERFRLLLQE